MNTLLIRYGRKTSRNYRLRAPDDFSFDGEKPGGGGTQKPNGNDSQNGGDDSNDDGNGDDDDSDVDLAAILGENDDQSDLDFSLESPEYQATEEEVASSKALGDSIREKLEAYSLEDADIPEDFDPSDRGAMKTLLANTQRKAIASTMGMMVPVINHALGVASKQMKHHMDNSITGNSAKTKQIAAFQSLGLSDKDDIALGKTIFGRALKGNKGDVAKATKATRKAFQALGKSLSDAPTNRNNGSGPSKIREGADALNDIFGK